MKKLLLALAGVAMFAGNAMAQDYEKNIYGVRAGLNVANISADGYSFNSKAGFHVSGVYQRLLTPSMPLYLETGLSISQKGCGGSMSEVKLNAMYLQVPILVNYKFYLGEKFVLYPSAGFYYALGLGGKCKTNFYAADDAYSFKSFGNSGILKRSDFGMRFSATAEWKKFSLSLGYEFGFMNVGKELKLDTGDFNDEDMDYNSLSIPKAKTGNFFISVGYNF